MKSSRKIWVKNLDNIVSKIVILRDGGCVLRGTDCASENHPTERGSILTNGHVFSRKNYNTRWDISENGDCHCQCWACNYRHVYDQYPYFEWYRKKFGQERFDALRAEAKMTKKWSVPEMRDYYVKLVAVYTDLVNQKKEVNEKQINTVRKLDDLVKSLYRNTRR